jgi:hypothetical protein
MGMHPLHVVLVTTIFMSNVSLNQAARSKLSSRQELAAKKKCKVQGFSDSLVCSTCNKLSIAVGEEGKNVVKECKSCCQNDGAVSYIQGVFSLCDWKLPQYPEVKTFLDEKAKNYNNLDIEYIRGKNPELIMEKSDGQKDHINVDRWKTDDIVEFLDSRLNNDS